MTEAPRIVCPGCGTLNRVTSAKPASAARCGSCRAVLFSAHPLEVGEAGFERHIRADSVPVLIDVWAPWCGPCRSMAPEFERAAAILEPEVRLLKLNADTAPRISAELKIRSIPTMLLFRDGHIVAETSGAMTAEMIVRWTRENLARAPAG